MFIDSLFEDPNLGAVIVMNVIVSVTRIHDIPLVREM